MIPHLEAVVNAAQGNPLSDVFKYMQEFCTEHATLKPLSEITNNIQAFITRSGYKPNSRDSDVEHDKTPVFSATSIKSNTEEIKAIFDDNDSDLKIEIVNENHDENLKKAEKRRADETAKVEADLKEAEQEIEKARQKVNEEYEKAYVAAENICQNEIKKFDEEIENIENEYKEVLNKADEMMKEAENDYKAVIKAADEECKDAIATAKKELDDAYTKYEKMLAAGEKRLINAEKQAYQRRQVAENHYEAALNRNLPDKLRERIENAMNRVEYTYQRALNQANTEWSKLQEAAEDYYNDALEKYEKDKQVAENEADEAVMEAYNLKQEIYEEYQSMVSNAQMELFDKKDLAEEKKNKACEEEQYYAKQNADEARNEAMMGLENQQMEIQDLAKNNSERIENEYHDDVEKILQEYQDAWNKADSLPEVKDETTASLNTSGKVTRNGLNGGAVNKKRQ
ncbi:hypothetical protein V9T40_000995 [Parthenolecanium corni]|uniref:Uncharacterized protein n=1 Tax=Parthenolecanium corni TaxID=536013 RepID=A0AAN9TRG2_9HEMI